MRLFLERVAEYLPIFVFAVICFLFLSLRLS